MNKKAKCKHKYKMWCKGEFSYLYCCLCNKLLRKVYTPSFYPETDNMFIVFKRGEG